MSAGAVTGELRAVLDAPRGQRFSRPGASARPMATPRARRHAREQHLLAQMAAHPNAVLPLCSPLPPTRTGERAARPAERDGRPLPKRPLPKRPPDAPPIPRPRPERPPLPKRPRSHRKPRRRSHTGWHLLGYTLATTAGALAHHLAPLLS